MRVSRRALEAIGLGVAQACLTACASSPPSAQTTLEPLRPEPVTKAAPDENSYDLGVPVGRKVGAGVNGRLPPEEIQRVVRASFGTTRRCYENGMLRNSKLSGMITTKFVIGEDGAVKLVAVASTSLPDAEVVRCVVEAFGHLVFPHPAGGMVTVVYPIMFNPAD
jgi:hypothetical protein